MYAGNTCSLYQNIDDSCPIKIGYAKDEIVNKIIPFQRMTHSVYGILFSTPLWGSTAAGSTIQAPCTRVYH